MLANTYVAVMAFVHVVASFMQLYCITFQLIFLLLFKTLLHKDIFLEFNLALFLMWSLRFPVKVESVTEVFSGSSFETINRIWQQNQ